MISQKLIQLICTELDLDTSEVEINGSTAANQLEGWDSLRNVSIIIRIEIAFGVKLKMIEILRCKNLGELQNLVDSKTEIV